MNECFRQRLSPPSWSQKLRKVSAQTRIRERLGSQEEMRMSWTQKVDEEVQSKELSKDPSDTGPLETFLPTVYLSFKDYSDVTSSMKAFLDFSCLQRFFSSSNSCSTESLDQRVFKHDSLWDFGAFLPSRNASIISEDAVMCNLPILSLTKQLR